MNYKEQITSGSITSWRRSYAIHIGNPRNQTPFVVFEEQDVTLLPDGKEFQVQMGNISMQFDPAATFNLLNPDTGEVVGQMTHQEVYAIMTSLYLDCAAKRDAQAAAAQGG